MTNFRSNRMYIFLLVLTIGNTAGFQAWRTLFNNFAVEVAGLQGDQIGIIQSLREIPGFLTFLVVYLLIVIKEHRLSALSVILMGFGVGITGLFPNYAGIMSTTMLMSLGFHYFETTNQSLTLQYFDQGTSPLVFGRLRSLAAAASIVVGLAIYALDPFLTYGQMFSGAGLLVVATGIWALLQNPVDQSLPIQRKQMVFRARYWLYYFLTFMAGARRQIFVAFAVFLMVKKFGFSVQEITLLFVANNVINYFINPVIGKSIIRFGERRVLSVEYSALIGVFLAYTLVQSKWLVALLYILDHLFFNFAIAIRTYFQKIGHKEDIAPSMAVGFTINHIAAVVLPAIGGALWMIDYRIPFYAGAVMSLVSLVAVQKIRT